MTDKNGRKKRDAASLAFMAGLAGIILGGVYVYSVSSKNRPVDLLIEDGCIRSSELEVKVEDLNKDGK